MNKIEGLHFQPWIGKQYESKGKLLLIGESHYIREKDNVDDDLTSGYGDFTRHVIEKNYLAGEVMGTPFFRNIGLMFNPLDEHKIWDEVAFANAIQIGFESAKCQPGAREISTIAPAFTLLLNHLMPNKIIVLSRRMWNYWIPEKNGEFVLEVEVNGKKSSVWRYTYDGGSCLAMSTIHPSRMFGNSCQTWKPLIDKFLSMN